MKNSTRPGDDLRPRVLLAGAGGMLGRALALALSGAGFCVVGASRNDSGLVLDITDAQSCLDAVSAARPDIVINSAAQANVDWCETHPDEAFLVNAQGPGNLARAAAAAGARFVHVSTDYVFSGKSEVPYPEDGQTGPINVYGRSKLEGEAAAMSAGGAAAVMRVCALYGAGGRNFVDTIAAKVRAGETLRVVDDQITRPTAASDAAHAIARALAERPGEVRGVFHVAAEGYCSWYGFARAICAALGADAGVVSPCSSAQFPRPAARPQFAVFDTAKFSRTFGFSLPGWQEALNKYLASAYA